MEWTRSHFNFPKYLTWCHDDTIRRPFHSITWLMPKDHFFITRKSVKHVKVHTCPGHWFKSFYSVGSFLWNVVTSNDAFPEVWGFSVTLEKWNDPSEWKTFGDNMSEYQPAFTCSLYYFTEFGRDVTAQFYWTNAWCSVNLERKLITYAIYTCTQKWYTDTHAQ